MAYQIIVGEGKRKCVYDTFEANSLVEAVAWAYINHAGTFLTAKRLGIAILVCAA